MSRANESGLAVVLGYATSDNVRYVKLSGEKGGILWSEFSPERASVLIQWLCPDGPFQ